MRKVIVGVSVFLVIILLVIWKFAPSFNKPAQKVAGPYTLNVWGLWEEDSFYKAAIDTYQKSHPNAKIVYTHQTSQNYRTRVQTQVTNNQGPDIFMIHNTWVPMFQQISALSDAPSSVINLDDFSKTFYPIAKESLVKNNKIYGLPTEVDGLALFYNEEILQAANVAVPTSWDEFVTGAVKMTVKDATGNIKTAGAALGTTNNVDHWSDILGLLFFQQPGVNLETPNTQTGADILRFYTNFARDPRMKVWDANMESSTQAFYSGKLAFYFAPSWRAYDIRTANPGLKFKVAPVPQLPGGKVGWASFWSFAVSKNSTHQTEAWEFLKYLTSKETEKSLYQEASKVRLFGEPYSRVDLQSELSSDPIVGAFVNQAPYYKSWYLASRTQDAGVNEQMIKYYEDAVNAVASGADPGGALQTLSLGVNEILTKYSPDTAAPK